MKNQCIGIPLGSIVCLVLLICGSVYAEGVTQAQNSTEPVVHSFFFMPQIEGVITDPSYEFGFVNMARMFQANISNITMTRIIGGQQRLTSEQTPCSFHARWVFLTSVENLTGGQYRIEALGMCVRVHTI